MPPKSRDNSEFDPRAELRRRINATPFRPFAVRTRDGRRFRVTDALLVHLPVTKRSEFSIYDRANADSRLRLADIVSITPIRRRKSAATRRQSTKPNRPRRDAQDWIHEWLVYIKPIQSRLARILHEQLNIPERRAEEVAFHLTDWEYELYNFGKLIYEPAHYTDREAGQMLIKFLAHVPNHLAAAAKLAVDLPVSDIFEVGAVELPNQRAKARRKKRSTPKR